MKAPFATYAESRAVFVSLFVAAGCSSSTITQEHGNGTGVDSGVGGHTSTSIGGSSANVWTTGIGGTSNGTRTTLGGTTSNSGTGTGVETSTTVSSSGGSTSTGGTATGGTSAETTVAGLTALGGAAAGGTSTIATTSGGTATGGTYATVATSGGAATGGVATGGVATGGVATGGVATGGVATGGAATGGVATGGVATGGTDPATGGAPDTTKPVLIAHFPASDATANPTDYVSVDFSESIACSTVDSSSFTVQNDVSGTPVVGTFSCTGATVKFTPTGGLALNCGFTVTVTGAVTDLAGNGLADAPKSWSFSVRDGTWSPAATVEASSATGDGWADVAIDGDGNGMVVWSRNSSGGASIWSNRYVVSSGSWSGAQSVHSDSSLDANSPVVRADAKGDFITAWRQGPPSGYAPTYHVCANRFVAGSGWGANFVGVATDGTTSGDSTPSLAVNASGDALLVWRQANPANGSDMSCWGSRFSATASTWTTPAVAFGTATSSSGCSAAIDANGLGIGLYSSNNISDISYISWPSGGNLTEGGTMETNPSGSNSWNPSIRVDGSGNFLGIWDRSADSNGAIWYNRWVPGTGWRVAASQVDGSEPFIGGTPDLAVNASGMAIAAWAETYTDTTNPANNLSYVTVNVMLPTATYWPRFPTSVASDTKTSTFGSASPRVGIDAVGNAMVVWTKYDSTAASSSVWASQYRFASGTWSTPTQLSLSSGSGDYPSIAMHPSGTALVAWRQNDGSKNLTYATWFR